jgi:hypothetical protein
MARKPWCMIERAQPGAYLPSMYHYAMTVRSDHPQSCSPTGTYVGGSGSVGLWDSRKARPLLKERGNGITPPYRQWAQPRHPSWKGRNKVTIMLDFHVRLSKCWRNPNVDETEWIDDSRSGRQSGSYIFTNTVQRLLADVWHVPGRGGGSVVIAALWQPGDNSAPVPS